MIDPPHRPDHGKAVFGPVPKNLMPDHSRPDDRRGKRGAGSSPGRIADKTLNK